jgi:hypothetical protein
MLGNVGHAGAASVEKGDRARPKPSNKMHAPVFFPAASRSLADFLECARPPRGTRRPSRIPRPFREPRRRPPRIPSASPRASPPASPIPRSLLQRRVRRPAATGLARPQQRRHTRARRSTGATAMPACSRSPSPDIPPAASHERSRAGVATATPAAPRSQIHWRYSNAGMPALASSRFSSGRGPRRDPAPSTPQQPRHGRARQSTGVTATLA